MARNGSERATAEIHVELVEDADNDDLHEALALYRQRIPSSERFEIPDIVRWIKEDSEQIQTGSFRPRDFFLVAKMNDQVQGFVLFHYFPKVRLAFIAYLVTATEQSLPTYSREGVAKKLLTELKKFFNGPLKDCEGILLEVDPPMEAATEQELCKRLARIRLFCSIAHSLGFSLRAFDMDYQQPPLSLENPEMSVPMTLMYTNPQASRAAGLVTFSFVRKILKFIYTDLYPEKYSDNDTENRKYAACLRKFFTARLKTVPPRIPMLDYKQIKARSGVAFKALAGTTHRPPESVMAIRDEPEATSRNHTLSRLANVRTASKVGTFYILDWALLSVIIGAALGLGGLAMSEGKYLLADVLNVFGVGLIIGKACYDHRNHELKLHLLLIFILAGICVLVGLLSWSQVNRRTKNQQTGAIPYGTHDRDRTSEGSAVPSTTVKQSPTPTGTSHNK